MENVTLESSLIIAWRLRNLQQYSTPHFRTHFIVWCADD